MQQNHQHSSFEAGDLITEELDLLFEEAYLLELALNKEETPSTSLH